MSACELEGELEQAELEQFEPEQPEPDEPGEQPTMGEIEATDTAQLALIGGVDVDCVSVNAPIIVRIDPSLTTCEFNGFAATYGNNWDATDLFDEGSPFLAGLVDPLPAESPLREFCRYDYVGTAANRNAAYVALLTHLKGANPPTGVDGDSAATDCPVIGPMSDQGLDTAAAREALHEAFMANLDAVSADDLENIARSDTRLVLLDTVTEGRTPQNEHGLQLENLIADIACPGDQATCRGWIEHVLVTPRVPDDNYQTPDWYGGSVGYMHEFSIGLAFALRDWAQTNLDLPLPDRQRLVVSAAVGADPSHPIASDPTYAPAQSAIAALQAAYCMGAVVYAAAGNIRDNACANDETGLTAPAAYEEFDVPSTGECVAWGYVADLPFYTYSPGAPLITAVSGLDPLDNPIGNHRREANTRLAATSAYAISSVGDGVITGTSVATAAVAGAHLLLWSLDREQTANAVTNKLYTTGYAVGRNADAGAYALSPIRRLGIRAAASDLLGVVYTTPGPDPDGNLGDYREAVDDAIADADQAELLIEPTEVVEGEEPDCSNGPDLDVFIVPQPEKPACATCSGIIDDYSTSHMLNMSIADVAWTIDLEVVAAYLHTYDSSGDATTFALPSSAIYHINQANPASVIQVAFETDPPDAAILEFVYADDDDNLTKQANSIPLL